MAIAELTPQEKNNYLNWAGNGLDGIAYQVGDWGSAATKTPADGLVSGVFIPAEVLLIGAQLQNAGYTREVVLHGMA